MEGNSRNSVWDVASEKCQGSQVGKARTVHVKLIARVLEKVMLIMSYYLGG